MAAQYQNPIIQKIQELKAQNRLTTIYAGQYHPEGLKTILNTISNSKEHVNEVDKVTQKTPLTYILKNRFLDGWQIFDALVNAGADYFIVDGFGKTPADYIIVSRSSRIKPIIALLSDNKLNIFSPSEKQEFLNNALRRRLSKFGEDDLFLDQLVEAGADPNLVIENITTKPSDSFTLLDACLHLNCPSLFLTLLNNGANIEKTIFFRNKNSLFGFAIVAAARAKQTNSRLVYNGQVDFPVWQEAISKMIKIGADLDSCFPGYGEKYSDFITEKGVLTADQVAEARLEGTGFLNGRRLLRNNLVCGLQELSAIKAKMPCP